VPLPSALRDAVQQELAGLDLSRVARAAERITADYKAGKFGKSLASPEARAAYLVTRAPATYAACFSAFSEIARLAPTFAPSSLLDLGAGPGTAAWAAAELWPSLQEFRLVEGNREFAEMGHRLAAASEELCVATWEVADLRSTQELPSADLVVLSYTIGELTDSTVVIRSAWNAARQLLVIVEPGTPRNFEHVAGIRRELIASGGHLLAPCPHECECSMATANDWCHFAARLQRTAEHRRMKGGALGYEDEKFSYLAFAKQPIARAQSRIVRHPMTHSGYIRLTLCTPHGLQDKTVTRSGKETFRAARRATWGDEWHQLE
jgi:ribosomal protein RSM22 (predicted rRNA methylase)